MELFEELAEKTIQEAELIDCSLPAFIEGLQVMEIAIRERKHQVEQELAENERKALREGDEDDA